MYTNTFKGLLFVCALAFTSQVRAVSYVLPEDGSSLVGKLQTAIVAEGQTLLDIGRLHGVGYREITGANPSLDPWVPAVGSKVLIPTRFILPNAARKGIVLNIPEMRLYYFPQVKKGEAAHVETYPISIGRMDWKTPLGSTKVVAKVRNPSWYPPQSVRQEAEESGRKLASVVPPGPDNPLGAHALRLGIPGYLIHGTNKPAGVGMRVTHGCLRMYPEDIETLFDRVTTGTSVKIVNQPYKVGWKADVLYLEAHTPLEEDTELKNRGLTVVTEAVVAATKDRSAGVDWEMASTVFEQTRGIPYPFSRKPVQMSGNDKPLEKWCDARASVELCGDTQP